MASGLSTAEVMFAAGSGVYSAPAGTAIPATPSAAVAAPWNNLGYVSEDGVTLTKSPTVESFGAWQSPDPIRRAETAREQTLAFALRQWNPTVLGFAIGGTSAQIAGPPAHGTFKPSKNPAVDVAVLFRWVWDTYNTQLYAPRGQVSGDIEAVLSRTAPADLAVTFALSPSGAEDAWTFDSENPAMASPTFFVAETEGEAYDPGQHTVAEVVDYVAEHPEQREQVLAAEQAGQNRSTLVAQLQGEAAA